MMELHDRVAFVTGGSSGIGLAIVQMLLQQGMRVAFTYQTPSHLDRAMETLKPDQDRLLSIRLDVTDRAAFSSARLTVERALGPTQLLINSAGVGFFSPIDRTDYGDWDWVLSVNLGGVINSIMTFLPSMLESKLEGHIVNVASMNGLVATRHNAAYGTSKFAVVGLSESLRSELGPRNIGVSVFCPGTVRSNFLDSDRNRPEGARRKKGVPRVLQEAFMANSMSPTEATDHVLRGIQENRLYILSHPEFLEIIQARNAALEEAIPATPPNELRVESTRVALSNPIYATARRGAPSTTPLEGDASDTVNRQA